LLPNCQWTYPPRSINGKPMEERKAEARKLLAAAGSTE
jgi:hypothetical protein